MKIGIFLHPYGESEPAGLGRAILDLTAALIAVAPSDTFVILVKGNPVSPPSFPGTNWSVIPCGGGWQWRDRGLAKAPKADAYLFHTPVMPLWRRAKKSVVIALDFAYLHARARSIRDVFRRLFLFWAHAAALEACSRIIAISDATRRDVIRFFRINEEKVTTVHFGFREICGGYEERYDAPEKFFLFVGVMKERKNVLAIVKAFARFASAHPEYHLLLVGKTEGEYGDFLKREAGRSSVAERIRFLGYRNDAELAYLYRRAAALVYPSSLEGFGFPVLEAMACGTAVIASRASSLPELAGEAGLLVNPDDIGEIAAAMSLIADDPALRTDLIAKGNEQVKKFSWEKAAGEMLKIFHAL